MDQKPTHTYEEATSSNGTHQPVVHDVDVLLQRIAELEKIETRFHEFVEGTENLITQVNAQGMFTYLNRAAQVFFGLSADEYQNESAFTRIHPDDQEYTQHAFMGWVANQAESVTFENRQCNYRGEVFSMLWTINLHYDQEGQLTSITSIARDITPQKRLEHELATMNAFLEQRIAEQTAELRQNQVLLQGIVDNFPGIIFVKDPQNRYILINRAVLALSGLSHEQILGQTPDALFPPHRAAAWQRHDAEIYATGQPISSEEVFPTPDGHHTYEIIMFPLFDGDRVIVATCGIGTDITQRKQVENDLRTFKMVVENAPDGVAFVSPKGSITYANPSLQAMLGYDNDLVGGSLAKVFGSDTLKPEQVIQQVIDQDAWKGLETLHRKDGTTLDIHLSVFAIRDAEGNIFSLPGFIRDLTDIKRAEAERAALQQQLIEAQQAAIRELSTPLLPLIDNVIAMPLVGAIDSSRAQEMMETLLEGVATHRAELVILDITGVQVVDTQVAQTFVRTAQAVSLLGAQVILTGIQPQIAQTLVTLGADLSGIITRSTLQAGIDYVLKRT